ILPPRTCPESVVPPHLPHGTESRRGTRRLLLAGHVSGPGSPTRVAPLYHRLGPDRVGRVCEAAARGPTRGAALPRPLYASHCRPQSGAPRLCPWPGHLPVEGLPPRQSPALHDAGRRRISPAFPVACAAAGLPTHSPLRVLGQRSAPGQARAVSPVPW